MSSLDIWSASYCDKSRKYNIVPLSYTRPVVNIDNSTEYSTKDLKRVVSRAILSVGDITRVWYVTVGYRYSKEVGSCHGWAYLNTGRFHVSIPHKSSYMRMKELCQVIQHEIDHCLGLDHSEMMDWWDIKIIWNRGLKKPRKG